MTFCADWVPENERRLIVELFAMSHRKEALSTSLRRLIAAVKQAGNVDEWPVCGAGDPVGDELLAALVEAEEIIGK